MTAHWIDPTTLQCCIAVISCKKLIGHNTYDVLAGKIDSIHRQVELCGKVTSTIADNGSNFVKAFKTFSVDPTPSSTPEEEIEKKEDNDQDEEEEATFENVCDALILDLEQKRMITILKLQVNYHHMKSVLLTNLHKQRTLRHHAYISGKALLPVL